MINFLDTTQTHVRADKQEQGQSMSMQSAVRIYDLMHPILCLPVPASVCVTPRWQPGHWAYETVIERDVDIRSEWRGVALREKTWTVEHDNLSRPDFTYSLIVFLHIFISERKTSVAAVRIGAYCPLFEVCIRWFCQDDHEPRTQTTDRLRYESEMHYRKVAALKPLAYRLRYVSLVGDYTSHLVHAFRSRY